MPDPPAPSCSALHRDAPLVGTAPRQTTWLVVECPKPWASKVEQSSGFPADIRDQHDWLKSRASYGMFCRVPVGEPRVIVYRFESERALEASCPMSAAAEWMESALNGPPQGVPAEPCLYVCTHGSRDSCCGRLGVPLLQAARAAGLRAVHECSHLGGHRFAPTVLLLPEWRLYGRVPPERAEDLLQARLPAEFLRGSCYLEPLLQVAQPAIEDALGEVVTKLELLESAGTRHTIRAETQFGKARTFAAVIEEERKSAPLSCGDARSGDYTEYRLEGLTS